MFVNKSDACRVVSIKTLYMADLFKLHMITLEMLHLLNCTVSFNVHFDVHSHKLYNDVCCF